MLEYLEGLRQKGKGELKIKPVMRRYAFIASFRIK